MEAGATRRTRLAGGDRSEEAVLLVVRAGREEEGRGRPLTAAPWPNCSDQSPSITTRWPLDVRSGPLISDRPWFPRMPKALIRPSPKLPTSREPLKWP